MYISTGGLSTSDMIFRYLHRHNWIKVAEAGLVSVVCAIIGFLLMFGVNECTNAEPSRRHATTSKVISVFFEFYFFVL